MKKCATCGKPTNWAFSLQICARQHRADVNNRWMNFSHIAPVACKSPMVCQACFDAMVAQLIALDVVKVLKRGGRGQ